MLGVINRLFLFHVVLANPSGNHGPLIIYFMNDQLHWGAALSVGASNMLDISGSVRFSGFISVLRTLKMDAVRV